MLMFIVKYSLPGYTDLWPWQGPRYLVTQLCGLGQGLVTWLHSSVALARASLPGYTALWPWQGPHVGSGGPGARPGCTDKSSR